MSPAVLRRAFLVLFSLFASLAAACVVASPEVSDEASPAPPVEKPDAGSDASETPDASKCPAGSTSLALAPGCGLTVPLSACCACIDDVTGGCVCKVGKCP